MHANLIVIASAAMLLRQGLLHSSRLHSSGSLHAAAAQHFPAPPLDSGEEACCSSTSTSNRSSSHQGSVRHASTWWRPWASQQQPLVGEASKAADAALASTSGYAHHFPDGTESFLATLQATRAGEHASIAAAKADAFFTSSWVMEAFQHAHESWGLPWCARPRMPVLACMHAMHAPATVPLHARTPTHGHAVLQAEQRTHAPNAQRRWGAIATINLLGRFATLPLAVYSQRTTANIAVGCSAGSAWCGCAALPPAPPA